MGLAAQNTPVDPSLMLKRRGVPNKEAQANPAAEIMQRGVLPTTQLNVSSQAAFLPKMRPSKVTVNADSQTPVTLAGSVVYSSAWPQGESDYGIYSFDTDGAPTQLTPVVKGEDFHINGGGFIMDKHLFFVKYVAYSNYALSYLYGYNTVNWNNTINGANVTQYNIIAYDMDYDPTTTNVYGCFFNEDQNGWDFGYFTTGTVTKTVIKPLDAPYFAIAIDGDGRVLGIKNDGNLYNIDKVTGDETVIGPTGFTNLRYVQSATFDRRTGKLYWAGCFGATSDNGLYEVDTQTGHATKVYSFPNHEEVVCLYVASDEANADAPNAPLNASANFNNDALTGQITFTIPTKTYSGSTLSGTVNYEVRGGGESLASGTAQPGENVTAEVTVPTQGAYDFIITASNAAGTSPLTRVNRWVGPDYPNAVASVTATIDDNNLVTITWDASTGSAHNGYVNPEQVTYNIVRSPDETTIATGVTGTTITDNLSEQAPGAYYYKVSPVYKDCVGDETLSENVLLGGVHEPPYINDIYNNKNIGEFTYANRNGGGTEWTYNTRMRALRTQAVQQGSQWVVSPLIALKQDVNYLFTVNGYTAGYNASIMEVAIGTGDNPDEFTTLVIDSLHMEMTSGTTYQDHVTTFFPPADGAYRFAFRILPGNHSDATWIRLVSLTEGSKATAPDSVLNINAVPAPLGELKTTVSVTTPVKNVKGTTLSNITKLEVFRNDTELVFTEENPELATEYTFEDNAPVNGFNTYTAICTNEDGAGPDKSTRVYVGVDVPSYPENIELLDMGNGTVRLTWDAPKGQNGGYVDPETVLYKVYRAKGNTAYLLADSVNAYYFDKDTTYVGSEPGDQQMIGMAVNAFTEMGAGPIKASAVLLGQPYEVPYKESFTDQRLETDPWTVHINKGQYSSFNFTESAADGDHGGFYLEYTSIGEEFILSSPMIDISKCKHPVLTYYYYAVPGQGLEQEVRISKATLEHCKAAEINHAALTGDRGWRKETIDLNDYKDARYIRIEFFNRILELGVCQFDNIQINDVDDYDLAVTLDAPTIVKPGDEININATVTNQGLKEIADDDIYTLNIYAGNELIGEEEETDLVAGEQQLFSYAYTVPEGIKNVNVRAELTLAKDTHAENNAAEFNIGVDAVVLDTIHDLDGQAIDAINLTWSNPDDMTARITDSFEDYPDFACDTIGNYTCINGLNPPSWVSRYVITTYYLDALSGLYAFAIFNAHAEGYDQYAQVAGLQAHTGNKLLYTTSLADEGFERSDSWFISPELSGVEQVVTFWARTYAVNYGKERIQLYYSTTDNNVESFRPMRAPQKEEFNQVLDVEVPGDWTQYGAYLPKGTKYFAVRYCSYDRYVMFMDDFTYNYGDMTIDHYNIYRNGELIGTSTEPTFADEDGQNGDEYTVTVVYEDGSETNPSNVYVASGITTLRDITAADRFNAIGQKGNIAISNLGNKQVCVYNAGGALIYKGAGRDAINVPADMGIYLVVSGNHAIKVAVK